MKNFKFLTVICIAFLSITCTTVSQTTTHQRVKIRKTPSADASDKILAIKSNNLVVETDLVMEDIINVPIDLEGYTETGTKAGGDLSLTLGNFIQESTNSTFINIDFTAESPRIIGGSGSSNFEISNVRTRFSQGNSFFKAETTLESSATLGSGNAFMGVFSESPFNGSEAVIEADRIYIRPKTESPTPSQIGEVLTVIDSDGQAAFKRFFNSISEALIGSSYITRIGDASSIEGGTVLTVNDVDRNIRMSANYTLMVDISDDIDLNSDVNIEGNLKTGISSQIGLFDTPHSPSVNGEIRLFNVANGVNDGDLKNAFSVFSDGSVLLEPVDKSDIENLIPGILIIDSSENNKLKLYDGTEWREISTVLD